MIAVTSTLTPLTIEDLMSYPDDGNRREIVQGELVVTPALTPAHQIVVGELFLLVGNFVRAHGLGRVLFSPVDVRLSRNDVVEPDLVFIPTQRESLLHGKFIDGLPELVIEVLSPSTSGMDLIWKRTLYAQSGIPEYWIVDPVAKTIAIHALSECMYISVTTDQGEPRSQVLQGLEIDQAKLFSEIPR